MYTFKCLNAELRIFNLIATFDFLMFTSVIYDCYSFAKFQETGKKVKFNIKSHKSTLC